MTIGHIFVLFLLLIEIKRLHNDWSENVTWQYHILFLYSMYVFFNWLCHCLIPFVSRQSLQICYRNILVNISLGFKWLVIHDMSLTLHQSEALKLENVSMQNLHFVFPEWPANIFLIAYSVNVNRLFLSLYIKNLNQTICLPLHLKFYLEQ